MGSHIIDGEFQSDKYPTTPRGKVPLSVKDPTAQDLLWLYADRRAAVDQEFADDLRQALTDAGYVPPEARRISPEVAAAVDMRGRGGILIQQKSFYWLSDAVMAGPFENTAMAEAHARAAGATAVRVEGRHEVGDRMGALMSANTKEVKFFGYGKYLGNVIPEPTGAPIVADMIEHGIHHPAIELDSGDVVYGCECWWGPEEKIRAKVASFIAAGAKLTEVTVADFRAEVAKRQDEQQS